MILKKTFITIIVTYLFLGNIKKCPGTFGSLGAFPILYAVLYLIPSSYQNIVTLQLFLSIIIFTLFIAGIMFSSLYIKNYTKSQDPKEIVIDEVVGQLITCTISFPSFFIIQHKFPSLNSAIINFIFIFLLPFVLFRFFDILKPWPIHLIDEKVKGGLGVMLDDVIAGIFAAVATYIIVFLITDFF